MGNMFVEQIKRFIAEVNARQVIVSKPSGEVFFKTPLMIFAIAVIAVILVGYPILIAIPALLALFLKYQVEIVRE